MTAKTVVVEAGLNIAYNGWALRSFLLLVAGTVSFYGSADASDRVGLVVRLADPAPVRSAELVSALARAGEAGGDSVERAPLQAARSALSAGAASMERLRVFADARRLSDEGIVAYQAADLEFAASRLVEARRVALSVADRVGATELIGEISLRLGVVRFELGDARATADFSLAWRLIPSRDVSVAEFKPAIVAAVQSARVIDDERAYRLEVSAYRGASISIDGLAVGKERWDGRLVPGLHIATAAGGGRISASELVHLDKNMRVELVGEVDGPVSALLRGRSSLVIGGRKATIASAIRGLLIYGDVDAVIVASATWRRGQPALLAERCEGVPPICTHTVEVGFPDVASLPQASSDVWRRLARAFLEIEPGLLLDSRLVSSEGPPRDRSTDTHVDWYRRPLVWVGCASVVAIATAFVLLSEDDDSRARLTIGSDVFR